MSDPAPEYIAARRVLLDALETLAEQNRGVVLVGAQAIYLRVGDGGLAVVAHTTDADLGLRPDLLAKTPDLAHCMRRAGFDHQSETSVGVWVRDQIAVDLLVPEAVGGPGRRAARLQGHDERAARKVRGLEGALFDHDPLDVSSLDPGDRRHFEIAVAGPAALVISKAHKIAERLEQPKRVTRCQKDALDIVRVLRGCDGADVALRWRRLLDGSAVEDEVRRATASIADEALRFLRKEFAVERGRGCDLAVDAALGAEEPGILRASTVELTRRLLARLS